MTSLVLLALPAMAAPLDGEAWLALLERAQDQLPTGQDVGPVVRELAEARVELPDGGLLPPDPVFQALAARLVASAPEPRVPDEILAEDMAGDMAGNMAGDMAGVMAGVMVDAVHHAEALRRSAAQRLAQPRRVVVSTGPQIEAIPPPQAGTAGWLDTLRRGVDGLGGRLAALGLAVHGGRVAAAVPLLLAGVGAMALGALGLVAEGRPVRVRTAAREPSPALERPVRSAADPRSTALRDSFLELLELLQRAGHIRAVARRTNGEVAGALDGELRRAFLGAAAAFERTCYGGEAPTPADADAVDRALRLARRAG